MGLERLNILFTFVNVSGLLPSRIVLDKKTSRFKRLDTHWRQPTTWWFLIILISQLIWTPTSAILYVSSLVSTNKEYIIYLLVISLWQVSHCLAKLIPHLSIFRFGKFKTVLEIISSVDRKLKQFGVDNPCSSRKRTIIGFGITSIWVSTIDFYNIKH